MWLLATFALVLSGCAIHYVNKECPQCRVLNAGRRVDGPAVLPRLRSTTRTLFILVPGALGYDWEWNPAVKMLEEARGRDVEFVVFWWEPLGTVRSATRELAHWVNDLLGASSLPALERVEIVAHSMAGLVAARAAPALVPPARARMRISTIGTAFAGMIGPAFGYPDSDGSWALFANFSPWLHYPAIPPGIDFVEYRTTWPEDPVMQPHFGHDPAPPEIGPRPRLRVQLPHMDHNACVGLVVGRLLKEDLGGPREADPTQRKVEPGR
jgi:hypothetical protein